LLLTHALELLVVDADREQQGFAPKIRRGGMWVGRGLLFNRHERRCYPALFEDSGELETFSVAA
jgi:hypothetical protein